MKTNLETTAADAETTSRQLDERELDQATGGLLPAVKVPDDARGKTATTFD
ncbi:MAG TPA: hypothetical protein VF495_00775 [Phenylobacterium sp.]